MSPLNSNNLPNEVTECHQIILQMQEQMQSMQGQLEALLRARYGSKVESIPPGQLRLFESADEEQEEELPVLQSETGLKSHGRKRISKALPRVPQIYDISESDIPCPGCGDDRPVIGEEKSEQYDYSPASIKVIEHIRLKRACRSCAEHVVIAPRPPSVIEKGMTHEASIFTEAEKTICESDYCDFCFFKQILALVWLCELRSLGCSLRASGVAGIQSHGGKCGKCRPSY